MECASKGPLRSSTEVNKIFALRFNERPGPKRPEFGAPETSVLGEMTFSVRLEPLAELPGQPDLRNSNLSLFDPGERIGRRLHPIVHMKTYGQDSIT
jgi:hypothetical protein